jgi:glycosyl transferase family 25
MWPAYVINLAANTRRLEESARQLDGQGIAWRRVEGVNGWALAPQEIARVYDAKRNRKSAKHPLVPPEVGCYLSHIAAWQAIAAGDSPGGFIFEDDFAADDSLGMVLDLLAADAKDGRWDMVKLFAFKPEPRLINPRPLGARHTIGVAYRVPTCLIAYGITRAAAARLAARAIPFFRPVDEDQKFFWETGLRVALVTPPPVVVGDQQAATGTVGDVRRKAARMAPRPALQRAWAALTYQLNYAVRLHYSRWRGIGQ